MRLLPLLLFFALEVINASAQLSGYLEMHKSKPVENNGLQFVVAVDSQYPVLRTGSHVFVEIQLFIINKSGHDLLFPTSDTLSLLLSGPAGRIIPIDSLRDGTKISLPVRINAGDIYCLTSRASIDWKSLPTHRDSFFYYFNARGTQISFPILKTGLYHLAFAINASKDEPASKPGLPPLWIGDAVTHEVPFHILEN